MMKYRIIGETKQIEAIINLIKEIANANVPVLITGEKGTGRELIARYLHYNYRSPKKRFIAINCASISSKLIESLLLGYDGTIFLSEIDELETSLQVKLLRVLKEKEFELSEQNQKINFKLISSTSRNLKKEIKSGNFREDLLYMLNVVQIDVPPLRSRKDDIPLLIDNFLNEFCLREKKMLKISDEVIDIFMNYPWQGNVRELKNVIERAVVLAGEPIITVKELPIYIVSTKPLPLATIEDIAMQGPLGDAAKDVVKIVEIQRIVGALRETKGNKKKAAAILQVCYKTLFTKINKYGIKGIWN
jgi:DNA-binding NtrC family response regulator